MSQLNGNKSLLHKIRAKLYKNTLGKGGAYIARTENEKMLRLDEIVENMAAKGMFSGNKADAVHNVKKFMEEASFLLCDGWAVNFKYFAVKPHICGSWDDASEASDREKHPVKFKFRVLKPLSELAGHIAIEITGIAESSGSIDSVHDINTGTVNQKLSIGKNIVIKGKKIKIDGEGSGLSLVPANGEGEEVAINGPFVKNDCNEIIALLDCPSLQAGRYRLRIRTLYSSGKAQLKELRTIHSTHEFEVA